MEPTFRQHKILESIEENGNSELRTGKEDNIELYWELVRNGFLDNLALLQIGYEWKFVLTDKAIEYLKDVNE